MSYGRAATNLVLDNAHVWGYPEKLGIGRDWSCAKPTIELSATGRSHDLSGEIHWDLGGDCEYVEGLNGIGPRGIAQARSLGSDADTIISGITVTPAGKWRPSPASGRFGNLRWLQYHDGRPGRLSAGEQGIALFNDQAYGDVQLWMYRHPIGEEETDPSAVELVWLGPEDHEGPIYGIILPRARRQTLQTALEQASAQRLSGPTLMGRGVDCDTWTVIDEYDRMSAGLRDESEEIQAQFDTLRVESIAGTMIARWFSREEAWTYAGTWQDAEGREVEFAGLPEGRFRIAVYGETIDITLAPVKYYREVTARPRHFLEVNGWTQSTAWYRRLARVPDDTELIVDYDQGANRIRGETDVTISGDTEGNRKRPVATFHAPAISGDTDFSRRRAVLEVIQEFRHATRAGAASEPIQTQDNDDLKLMDASGSCDGSWRGATMSAQLEAKPGSTMPEIGANQYVRCETSVDGGASYHTQFSGRVAPPQKHRQGVTPVQGQIDAEGDDKRLERHPMYQHCCYEAWPLPSAFTEVLTRGGVPTSRIWFDPSITEDEMGPEFWLPRAEPGADRLFSYGDSATAPEALDDFAAARDLQWGWDHGTEKYFIRPYPTHTAGAYDYEFEAATDDDEKLIVQLRHMRTYEDFVNLVVAMAGSGWDATAAMLANWASMTDPTDPAFVGDDWLHIEHYEDEAIAHTMARRLYEQRGRLASIAYLDLQDMPELHPDHEIRLVATDLDIPDGAAIYQLERKNWNVEQGGARYRQTAECVLVE